MADRVYIYRSVYLSPGSGLRFLADAIPRLSAPAPRRQVGAGAMDWTGGTRRCIDDVDTPSTSLGLRGDADLRADLYFRCSHHVASIQLLMCRRYRRCRSDGCRHVGTQQGKLTPSASVSGNFFSSRVQTGWNGRAIGSVTHVALCFRGDCTERHRDRFRARRPLFTRARAFIEVVLLGSPTSSSR